MVLCKFYQQGYCRYGNNCRFEHSLGYKNYDNYDKSTGRNYDNYDRNSGRNYNDSVSYSNRFSAFNTPKYEKNDRYNTYEKQDKYSTSTTASSATVNFKEFIRVVKEDAESSLYGKQWPFSCYSPTKHCVNFPGLGDISPEELRWEAFTAEQNNSFDNYIKEVKSKHEAYKQILQSLKNPSSQILNILNDMHQNKITDSPKHGPSTGFGKSSAESSTVDFKFSLDHLSSNSAPAQLNAFQLPSSSNASFGGTQSSIFGTSNASFGNAPFGNSSMNATFGSSSAQSSSIFGGSSSNAPFGISSAQGSIFGNSSAPFESPSTSPTSVFGNTSTNEFNQPPDSSVQNFSFKLPAATPGFGSGFTNTPSSGALPFGLPENSSTQSQTTFGKKFDEPLSGQKTNFSFGTATGTTPVPDNKVKGVTSRYTSIESLLPEDKEQFLAENFTFGKIPLCPPPLEMCK